MFGVDHLFRHKAKYTNELKSSTTAANEIEMTDKSLKIQIKEKPKVCAIDLEPEIIDALKDKGLQCFSGTLGSQVKVPNSSRANTHPCLPKFDFPPNLHEYDIVIVDLQARDPIEYDESEHRHSSLKGSEKTILLSSYPETIFDPRPVSASILKKELNELFKKETLIIVFSAPEEVVQYHFASLTRYGYKQHEPVEYSLYGLLPCVEEVRNKNGRNIVISSDIKREELRNIFSKYSNNFIYHAVFGHPTEFLQDKRTFVPRDGFIPLLLNADHEIVGFIDIYNPSVFFVIPQIIKEKKEFLIELFDEVLPGMFPKIFPYHDQFLWLKSDFYQVPNKANLLVKKEKINAEYNKALEQIECEIQQNQFTYQFLHDLLTETGDFLVKSVEQFFRWLGFTNIINMDETNPEIKEEDIQIHLNNGLLVVEIKGIRGTSKDSECSQVSKIKYRRAQERGSFDVFALYIVNHQRYLAPHERRNPPFIEQQIADAQSDERGLLTTYELFKLYFNIQEGFVTKEDARYALLQYGLVQFKPSNAHFIGLPLEIHHKGTVLILVIDNTLLYKGATIVVCNDGACSKAEILEIQENGKTVESASNGEIGVQLSCSVLKTSELWLHDTNVKPTSSN